MSGGPYYPGGCLQNLPYNSVWEFFVHDTSGVCSDFTNAVAWINAQTAPPWQMAYTGTFNSPASTVPDSENTSPNFGPAGNSDAYSLWNLTGPELIKTAVLTTLPTLYCVAYWFDSEMNFRPQASCIMAGIPSSCGNGSPAYAYNPPLPSLDGCNPTTGYNVAYDLYDEASWQEFMVNECPEGSDCYDLLTPGPCPPQPQDPFNDEDP
jgi:hypothetical protein